MIRRKRKCRRKFKVQRTMREDRFHARHWPTWARLPKEQDQ